MKSISLLLALAAPLSVVAQTAPAKPATTTKPATTAVHRPGVAAASTGPKLPPGVAPVRGPLKTAFALRYQDISIGTGALAEPLKLYKVHYTGWLAADGKKFDSSFDHTKPVVDKDGKPEMNADGKPKMTPGEPIQFPQGRGRVIPGWDQGFEGMHIGGKRRLFIPYQLAYGALGRPPVIPAKSDLIFDVELVAIDEMPTPPAPPAQGTRPMPGGAIQPKPSAPAGSAAPAAPAAPATPPPANAPATPPTPAPPDKPANPTQPN